MADLSDMKASVARVESDVSHLGDKISFMHNDVVKLLDGHQTRLNNHGDRVKSLEISRGRLKGATWVFSGIAAAVGSFIVYIKS